MKPNFTYQPFQMESSFRTFIKNQEITGTPLHYHPDYEMNFVISGLGTRRIGNNIEDFEEGDLILLAPNIPHRWKNTNKKRHPYSSLVIQWKEDFLAGAWETVPEFTNIKKLLKRANKGVKFDAYISREIRKNQSALLMLPPFEKLILLLQILNDLAKTDEFKTLDEEGISFSNSVPNARIDTVCRFIKAHYSEKITLSKVAALVNMSEGSFSRFFSQTTQKPFFSFLNEFRIKMACKMLGESDMQVNEIAYACGYDCLQFFYRQFTRYAKCAPQNYRKKILEL